MAIHVRLHCVNKEIALSIDITLAVITYNSSKYIQETIDSILNLNTRPRYLLFFDNSSSDETIQIIQKNISILENKMFSVLVFQNEYNSFSSGAVATLLKIVPTKYLSVFHGDDLINASYFEIVTNFLSRNNDIDILNVSLQEFDSSETSNRILRPLWSKYNWLNRILVAGLNPGTMPGAVLNLDRLRGLNPYEKIQPVNGVEDTILWAFAVYNDLKIRGLLTPIVFYRRHPSQSSNSSANAYFSGIARKFLIDSSPNFVYRILSKSEINYERKVFQDNTNYLNGLGKVRSTKIESSLRFFNILARRTAVLLRQYESKLLSIRDK